MELTGSKGESIKPILIMAGIPLAFSVASLLISRIRDRKIPSLQDQIEETSPEPEFSDHIESTHDVNHLKEEIFVLRSKLEELQEHEREIESQFVRCNDLKDQEHALMEVSSMEYLKALEELESSRIKNGLLRRRVKKLLKKTRETSRFLRKQNSKIEEMQAMIHRLRDEKNEALMKLETAENAVSLKAEAERALTENHDRLVNELRHLQEDREAEVKELIYLRWCHACLKHELTRRNQLEHELKPDMKRLDEEGSGIGVAEGCTGHEPVHDSMDHHEGPFLEVNEQQSKRRWLGRKFKKWIDGRPTDRHHEAKCFGTHSVVDEAEERHLPERKSLSSV